MTSRRARGQILVLVAVPVAVGVAMIELRPLVALVIPALIGLGALVLLVRVCRSPDDSRLNRRVVRWTLIAFAVHFAVGAVISSSGTVTEYFGGDARYYHDAAIQLAQHWDGVAAAPLLPAGKEGFIYALSGMYFVFGAYLVAGLVLNATLSAGLVPLVFDTTRRLFGAEAARRVIPLVVILPGFLVWTSQLLREAGIVFFIALAANAVVRLNQRFNLPALVALAFAIAGLFSFRGNVAFVVAIGLLGALVIGRRGVLPGLGAGATAAALAAILIAVVGVGYTGYRLSVNADLEQVNTVRSDLSRSASSGVSPEADVSTTSRALDYLPEGALQFGLGPFPWQIANARQSFGLVEALVLWALLPAFLRGCRIAWRTVGRRTAALMFPALLLTVMLSLLIGNFGTVTRERLQVLVLVLPILAVGLAGRNGHRSEALAVHVTVGSSTGAGRVSAGAGRGAPRAE